jgi:hypothetical protein
MLQDGGNTMALRKEQHEKQQADWASRYEDERRNLSASVEDTLASPQDEQLEEEEDQESSQTPSVITPRLTLQSKQLAAVQPGAFVQSALEAQSDQAEQRKDEHASPANSAQRGNAFTRFAQRLTTSLPIIGTAFKPDSLPPLPPPSPQEKQLLKKQREASLLPPSRPSTVSEEVPARHPESAAPKSAPTVQPQQRLAGRTARIRLETASIPSIAVDEIVRTKQAVADEVLDAPAVQTKDMTAMESLIAEIETTKGALPAVSPLEVLEAEHALDALPDTIASESATPRLSGSGTINHGQGDVTMTQAAVTAESVVIVTLTSNPGPVVVQYISLQPHQGFTIHLTAPVTKEATFNYVIL